MKMGRTQRPAVLQWRGHAENSSVEVPSIKPQQKLRRNLAGYPLLIARSSHFRELSRTFPAWQIFFSCLRVLQRSNIPTVLSSEPLSISQDGYPSSHTFFSMFLPHTTSPSPKLSSPLNSLFQPNQAHYGTRPPFSLLSSHFSASQLLLFLQAAVLTPASKHVPSTTPSLPTTWGIPISTNPQVLCPVVRPPVRSCASAVHGWSVHLQSVILILDIDTCLQSPICLRTAWYS